MRILLSTDLVGGVWDYAVTLAEGLVNRGVQVMLAAIGPEEQIDHSSVPLGVELVVSDFRLEWMPEPDLDLARAADWLRDTARHWDADILHLNQMAYAAHGFETPTIVVAHSDVISWFSETLGAAAPAEWSSYRESVRAGLIAADMVVTPSVYQSDLLRMHFGRPTDFVIYNAAAAPPAGGDTVRDGFVIAAGRAWDEAKGMEIIDEALIHLADSAPTAHLFGSTLGPMGERYHSERVRCHGKVPKGELGSWMNRASAFISPSRYEPFGLAPLEAALHRCPLILSDIGSFRELWSGCAVFFRSGDSRSLAERLVEIGQDPDGQALRAHAARERALTRYGMG
ncbi:MAG: glycosyltransferase family 4 protein, partial [Gemmatimonadetes bacterium]|nr:glycosyltransferase family 4 protein [Gemmatimonadota bacterium]